MNDTTSAPDRRSEILDIAERLILAKGYDRTSMAMIQKACGIARGTLYYHFPSKEAILDAVIDRLNQQVLQQARAVATQQETPVIERFFQTLARMNVSEQHGEILDQMHQPQNALFHDKVQHAMLQHVPPILTTIIRDGIDQGIFNTRYPYEAMEMLITYVNEIFDLDMADLTPDAKQQRLIALGYHLERLLGMAEGSLAPYFEAFYLKGGTSR